MFRNTHQYLILFFLLSFLIQNAHGQKLKLDTVYYDRESNEVTKQSDYLTYEVRRVDRKKRPYGTSLRYTKTGRMTESSTYVKGEKTGIYYRFNPAEEVMMYGNYTKGIKTGFWIIMGRGESIRKIEEYDDQGKLIGSREGLYSIVKEQAVYDGDTVTIDSLPEFVGGQDGWNLFLRTNLRYPLEAKRGGYQGFVYLSFVVLSDGRVIAPMVVDSPHPSLSEEGLRILSLSPDWFPAMVKDKPVDAQMQLRLAFRLK